MPNRQGKRKPSKRFSVRTGPAVEPTRPETELSEEEKAGLVGRHFTDGDIEALTELRPPAQKKR